MDDWKPEKFQKAFLVFRVGVQAFLKHGAELLPEVADMPCGSSSAIPAVCRGLSRQGLFHFFDDRVVLKHLARHIERKVFGVHHALDKSQVFGKQVLAVVHDENPPHVQLDAMLAFREKEFNWAFPGMKRTKEIFQYAFGFAVQGQRGRFEPAQDCLKNSSYCSVVISEAARFHRGFVSLIISSLPFSLGK